MIFTTLATTNSDLVRVCHQQLSFFDQHRPVTLKPFNPGGILLHIVFFVYGPNRPHEYWSAVLRYIEHYWPSATLCGKNATSPKLLEQAFPATIESGTPTNALIFPHILAFGSNGPFHELRQHR
jgi:hypothetical protein